MQPDQDSFAQMMISNPSAVTQEATYSTTVGEGLLVCLEDSINPPEESLEQAVPDPEVVRRAELHEDEVASRKEKLRGLIPDPEALDPGEKESLLTFLTNHHLAFCLDENKKGETDLLQFEIDTGDAPLKKHPPRRMPFAVCEEVARQLKKMQETGVVESSSSPWASPVVMVRKKDGTHQFCVDYRDLNAVTKADKFLLPRIDDLLDQLGKLRYFSTLDLALGYWQIRVQPDSRENTAFVTPQGLYKFRVMLFGLTNTPTVFQRHMQRVLMGLNPGEGQDFVAVYIDNVLVCVRILTYPQHLEHLRLIAFNRQV